MVTIWHDGHYIKYKNYEAPNTVSKKQVQVKHKQVIPHTGKAGLWNYWVKDVLDASSLLFQKKSWANSW